MIKSLFFKRFFIEGHLKKCNSVKDKFKKFTLVPVIWPSSGGISNYFSDRGYSKGAGEALKIGMSKYAGMFPKKSLLAHSMGNRVLRHAAGKYTLLQLCMIIFLAIYFLYVIKIILYAWLISFI